MKKSNLLIIIFLTVLNLASLAAIQVNVEDVGFKRIINNTEVEIKFYSPEIVRIIKSSIGNSFEKESLSVIKEPERTSVKIDEDENEIKLSSSSLIVSVDKNTGVIKFSNVDNEILIAEKTEGAILAPKKYAGVDVFNVK